MTHEAGQNATVYPDGLGVRLTPGSALAWRVHTHSFGEEVVGSDRRGLQVPSRRATRRSTRCKTGAIGGMLTNNDLDIPAGEDNIRFDAVGYLRTPAKLVTLRAAHACRRQAHVSERHATRPASGRR